MKLARILFVLLAAVPVLAAAALAGGGLLGGATPATARFHDLEQAVEAGYDFRLPDLTGATCIAQPGAGAMGVHMVDVTLLDGVIDAAEPEVLVYEPRPDGSLKLVALEYVVFEADWTGEEPPSLFGHEFGYTGEPNRYGLPPFYALHAWAWKPNPSGMFAPWNPRVDCG